jgi:hypothetical protein
LVNVPIRTLLIALSPWLLREDRAGPGHRRVDLAGAAHETTLVDAFRVVEDELKAVARGNPVARSVAATMIDSVNGNSHDDFLARIITAAACVEWDVDAAGAWGRVREALVD